MAALLQRLLDRWDDWRARRRHVDQVALQRSVRAASVRREAAVTDLRMLFQPQINGTTVAVHIADGIPRKRAA